MGYLCKVGQAYSGTRMLLVVLIFLFIGFPLSSVSSDDASSQRPWGRLKKPSGGVVTEGNSQGYRGRYNPWSDKKPGASGSNLIRPERARDKRNEERPRYSSQHQIYPRYGQEPWIITPYWGRDSLDYNGGASPLSSDGDGWRW